MAAAPYSPTIDRGITFTRTLLAKQSDGTAFDLTDCELAGMVRTSPNSPQLIAEFDIDINEDPTTGLFTIEITKEDTAKMDAGQYTFDIVLTLASEKNRKVITGTITVVNTNTR